MKTVIIQQDNKNVSPLVSSESIYDLYPLLAGSTPVGPWIFHHPTENTDTNIILPYSVNSIDGHTNSYARKNNWEFNSSITIHKLQPTYLWFTYATQTAKTYINGTLVNTHPGGYNSFFVDITNSVIVGTNTVKILIDNTNANGNMPDSGDFNMNATLGEVYLLTSPVLPATNYGYDGFHIDCSVDTSVSPKVATLTIETEIPTFGDVICKVDDKDFHFVAHKFDKGNISFTVEISNPNLWQGTEDPHLYDITLEIYHNEKLYHRLKRPYGIRYYEYVIDDTTKVGTVGSPYTGFLLNGQIHLLRGVCMHHDIDGKANALSIEDIDNNFSVLKELGANVVRLAHYPHPKQIYDYCDKLGIVVQTEIGWVNTNEANLTEAKKENILQQCIDMINQHYNHTSIIFWGLGNEIKCGTDSEVKEANATYMNYLRSVIRGIKSDAWVGFVMAATSNSPANFGNPNLDWFGCNDYVGWYNNTSSNNPTSDLNTRKTNFITNFGKPYGFSEYGCGGNQDCHSDTPSSTTTKGSNQPRHDIEYQMWLHEGHIAAIRDLPYLVFTTMWMMFDIAVYNRQEGYVICLDGETTSEDNNYKFLNNKGLVKRDHITRKDTFYLYKAEWNKTDKFVHICGKNYTKKTERVIKCYSNDWDSENKTFNLYINKTLSDILAGNETPDDTAIVQDPNNIVTFTAGNYSQGNIIIVTGNTSYDSFIIG